MTKPNTTKGALQAKATKPKSSSAKSPTPSKPKASPAVRQRATAAPAASGKIGALIGLLRQPGGCTVEAMMQATGWQAHSVRGAMSGAIKKVRGLPVASEKTEAGRIYRITEGASA